MTVLGIVFSMDRAAQLDATLRSLYLHCMDAGEMRLYVIYKTTTTQCARQYAQLAREHCCVGFLQEKDFRRDVLELLYQYSVGPVGVFRSWLMTRGPLLGRLNNLWLTFERPSHVLFLVDDNVFVGRFALGEIEEMLEAHQNTLGFSLRLGTNTTYCYPLDKPQTVPSLVHMDHGAVMFDWSNAAYDFGYPLEVSSSVYRIRQLLPFLNRLSFQTPNTLEGQMAANASYFRTRNPHMLCYERSVAFCVPLNIVQTTCKNRAANAPEYSAERLAKMYDDGYRIDIEAYSGFVPNACHQEVALQFRKQTVS